MGVMRARPAIGGMGGFTWKDRTWTGTDAPLAARILAQTDLLFLCRLLGYADVSPEIHGPLLDRHPPFDGGEVRLGFGGPGTPLWQLRGPRRSLFLCPRGY